MLLNILTLNSYQYILYSFPYCWNEIGKNISHSTGGGGGGGGGGGVIMAMSTGACWVGHFCVEPGIFVSNECYN